MLRVLDSLLPELDWRLAVSLCLIFFLAGIAVIVGFRRVQSTGGSNDKRKLLELALNNMTQGVVMFDAKARPGVEHHDALSHVVEREFEQFSLVAQPAG